MLCGYCLKFRQRWMIQEVMSQNNAPHITNMQTMMITILTMLQNRNSNMG